LTLLNDSCDVPHKNSSEACRLPLCEETTLPLSYAPSRDLRIARLAGIAKGTGTDPVTDPAPVADPVTAPATDTGTGVDPVAGADPRSSPTWWA